MVEVNLYLGGMYLRPQDLLLALFLGVVVNVQYLLHSPLAYRVMLCNDSLLRLQNCLSLCYVCVLDLRDSYLASCS